MKSEMGDSIIYCQDCETNVACHLNRECLRLKSLCPSDATPCSGFRVTLEAVGLTKSIAMAHAVRVLALMMEEAHTKGHSCGTINGNASAKLDEIP